MALTTRIIGGTSKPTVTRSGRVGQLPWGVRGGFSTTLAETHITTTTSQTTSTSSSTFSTTTTTA